MRKSSPFENARPACIEYVESTKMRKDKKVEVK